jgi:hypothetical protein
VPAPLAAELRAAILADITAGTLSARAIAKRHGVAASTVSKLAADNAVPEAFERAQTRKATHAREADNAARRATLAARRLALAEDFTGDAERLRAQLWQPHLYFDWGGKEHDYDERVQPEPTAADKRALMGAAAVAVDKSLKLAPADGGDDPAAVRSMLGALGAALAGAFGTEEDDSGG